MVGFVPDGGGESDAPEGAQGGEGLQEAMVAIVAGGTLNWVHGHHLGTPIVTTSQIANRYGLALSDQGQCATACNIYGPRGLPAQY